MRNIFLFLICALTSLGLNAQIFDYADDNPIELGKVSWLRNYDEALTKAEKEDKPIFILFQEVPGCGNCTKYGQEIMSHPLIVEAIEDDFIPLAIYNNKNGHDKEVLDHFGEPSWNNPVVRMISKDGSFLGSRISNFNSTALLISEMSKALKKSKNQSPQYLKLLAEEFSAIENGSDDFYLSMFCFWTGEKEIAQLKGVIATEAGFMHGREVVKVKYDKSKTDIDRLATKAGQVKCADQVFTDVNAKGKFSYKKTGKYRKDIQDKYYLLHSPLKAIPMTNYQKAKVNSALGSGMDAMMFLSPRQLYLLEKSKKGANYIDKDIVKSWYTSTGR